MTLEAIAVRLPEKIVSRLDTLVSQKGYTSRGEVIRIALRYYYINHFSKKMKNEM
ncbi:MAG: ribbon-helix-helix domain-containing protein [Candidatus Heimdallarchaeaceae archaeon]